MKRGAEYTKITVKKTGQQYNLHTIVKDEILYPDQPRGTHVVLNPKYNGEPKYLYFHPSEVEPVYPQKDTTPWYEKQRAAQDREVKDV